MKRITFTFVLFLILSNFFISTGTQLNGSDMINHHHSGSPAVSKLQISNENLTSGKLVRVKQSQKAKASRLAELLHILFPTSYA